MSTDGRTYGAYRVYVVNVVGSATGKQVTFRALLNPDETNLALANWGANLTLTLDDKEQAFSELPTTVSAPGHYGWLFVKTEFAAKLKLGPAQAKWPTMAALGGGW